MLYPDFAVRINLGRLMNVIKNFGNLQAKEWAPRCFAWEYISIRELSIKLEKMAPRSESEPHAHKTSRQVFFIIKGEARFYLVDKEYVLKPLDGIEVTPRQKHWIVNVSDEELLFLLVSSPRTEDDALEKDSQKLSVARVLGSCELDQCIYLFCRRLLEFCQLL